MAENLPQKNSIVQRELEVLEFWKNNRIFEKSLKKPAPKGEFIFYEGPPTANGKPGIHHLEARAFKDAIPRYKTMQGFQVARKGGWDTHGLPVELAVEKQLGLKSKKEIETYGIEAFNQKCKESVWTYVREWEDFTERIGYWVDLKRPYVTYKPYYIESVWNIVSKINERGLLYKDYKVVPWCPRCGTALSSHELAQGYEDVKDLSVYVKFSIFNFQFSKGEKTYLLAWTTTPWTLPGNVGLAINPKTIYCQVKSLKLKVKSGEELVGTYIVAKERLETVLKDYEYEVVEEFLGEKLVGLEYEPLYPFLKENLSENENPKLKNAFKVYAADFVTTTEGMGIVHTAVMYGADDFELGTKVGLPKHHLVNEDGTFKEETGFLAGKFVKDEATDVEIIKDLASRGLLFAKEKYAHSYPHCWRCHTPLIYFARDSWYIKMSALRDELISENQKINWEPSYIKDGRFGEWLKDVKDWAISRERYWGTPLPIWECASCGKRKVAGSFGDLYDYDLGKKLTRLILLRHGESEKNVFGMIDSSSDKYPLIEAGEKRAKEAGKVIGKLSHVAAIYASPVLRTKQTAEIVGQELGLTPVMADELWEVRSGEWDGKTESEADKLADRVAYNRLSHDGYYKTVRGKTGESWQMVEDRMTAFIKNILAKHQGETVVIISHEGPLMTLLRVLKNISLDEICNLWEERRTFHQGILGGYAEPTTVYVDNQTGKEIDPHRPFIDDFYLRCECGSDMKRVKEVMDVWFDSGAMPFAQGHYPFKHPDLIDGGKGYPADFISEAIDQTRGWFYTLHAIGALMGKGRAYKNVICLGHILDAEGKKMSKSVGNVVDPNIMMEKYGADALRFWMYSVNQPGEPKNFDEKTVDELVKKVFNLASNVLAFYKLYESENHKLQNTNHKSRFHRGSSTWSGQIINSKLQTPNSENVLDRWITARLNQLIIEVTDGLEKYKLLEPARAIKDFIADLSQWYLQCSRDRIKNGGEDSVVALATLNLVLRELSKIMAPFTPFFAEYLYKDMGGEKESVHLEEWPLGGKVDADIIAGMSFVRSFTSMVLMQRAEYGIKVRQPLQKLSLNKLFIKHSGKEPTKYWSELVEVLKGKVNVKEVVLDSSMSQDDPPIKLDITITTELKEEGDVREFTRAVQEFRKEMKLNPSDGISLVVETDEKGRVFLEKNKTEVGMATLVQDFVFESVLSGRLIVSGDFSFRIGLRVN